METRAYRVLVRGTLHRGGLVESSSLHVLPSAFGPTVVLLPEVFRCVGDCKSEVAKVQSAAFAWVCGPGANVVLEVANGGCRNWVKRAKAHLRKAGARGM